MRPPFTGNVECWEVTYAHPDDDSLHCSGWVLAVTWFDARAEAFRRLAECGEYDPQFEVKGASDETL